MLDHSELKARLIKQEPQTLEQGLRCSVRNISFKCGTKKGISHTRTMAGKGLLLVDSQVVEGRLVGEAAELFSLPAENVDVVSCSGRLGNDALPKGAYTRVLSLAFSPGHHSTGLLSLISAALRPGMYLTVKEPRSPQVMPFDMVESGGKSE